MRRLVFALLASFVIAPAWGAADFPVKEHGATFESGGRKIQVEVFAPKRAGRFPAVLVLHSAAGMLIGKGPLVKVARQLAAHGRVAFLVHYFDRTGTIFAGDKSIHENSQVWTDTIKDAVDFVAAQPDVDAREIGIFGYSLGAYLAVAESSRDPRIDAIVEVSGGIFENFSAKMQRLPATLILHGRADQRVPIHNAFALQKRARQLGTTPEIKIYEGEPHVLSPAAVTDAERRAVRFFDTHLGR